MFHKHRLLGVKSLFRLCDGQLKVNIYLDYGTNTGYVFLTVSEKYFNTRIVSLITVLQFRPL